MEGKISLYHLVLEWLQENGFDFEESAWLDNGLYYKKYQLRIAVVWGEKVTFRYPIDTPIDGPPFTPYQVIIHASDPQFFEKLHDGIQRSMIIADEEMKRYFVKDE
jgi:hypothetical protein